MPLYEFNCDTCGQFEAWRTLAELEKPMLCPSCAVVSKRIFSPPMVNLNSGSLFSIASKANSEPQVVKREKEPSSPKYQSPKGGRPWMIGHAPPR